MSRELIIQRSDPNLTVTSYPATIFPAVNRNGRALGDFASALPDAAPKPIRVTGPDNRKVDTHWLLLPDGTGLVELAATSGVGIVGRLRPLTTHTRGFGHAIAAALDHGVPRLVLVIGGGCPTDAGVGALRQLGAEFLDERDRPIPDGGIGLVDLAAIDLSRIRRQPPGGVVVLTDHTHPLIGRNGAANTFARRNGATAVDVARLERGLRRLAAFELLPRQNGLPRHRIPGTGAGGGLGYGLQVWSAFASPGRTH